jgi:hypothetical protein
MRARRCYALTLRILIEGDTMRLITALLVSILAAAPVVAGDIEFEDYFTGGALRVDLYHTGTAATETYALDELIREPFWGGNPKRLLDTMNLGGHLMRVYDLETNGEIFSRGYCSLFGEWATTDEAIEGFPRTFQETLLLPMPKRPVQIRIDRRDRGNVFHNVFDLVVDPSDYHIMTETRYSAFRVRPIENNGSPEHKVDIVILADGYTVDELHKLREDVARFMKVFFDTEPYAGRRKDFNVRLIESVSAESGVDDPRKGVYRDNLLGLSFNSFDLDRYMLSLSNKAIRDVAAKVPYDIIIILANEEKYGGGGIFNLYSTCVSDNEYDGYIFTHEFGHAFAGLGDEYYSSEVAYNDMYPRGVEPWEPNITALLDPAHVKWGSLIKEGTPVPTPDDSLYADVVGCFEGAGYSAKGLYRPYHTCRMFDKGLVEFCPVCRKAISDMIDFHTH